MEIRQDRLLELAARENIANSNQLAETASIERALAYRLWNKQKKTASGETIRRLAISLKTNPDYLTGESDDPRQDRGYISERLNGILEDAAKLSDERINEVRAIIRSLADLDEQRRIEGERRYQLMRDRLSLLKPVLGEDTYKQVSQILEGLWTPLGANNTVDKNSQ